MNSSAHGVHKLLGDGHAQPGSLERIVGVSGSFLREGIENLFDKGRAHADAGIFAAVNGCHAPVSFLALADGKGDISPLPRELGRVADDIDQYLFGADFISFYTGGQDFFLYIEFNAFFFNVVLLHEIYVVNHGFHIKRSRYDINFSRLKLRHVENVIQ